VILVCGANMPLAYYVPWISPALSQEMGRDQARRRWPDRNPIDGSRENILVPTRRGSGWAEVLPEGDSMPAGKP
jgi:hypothetical protein